MIGGKCLRQGPDRGFFENLVFMNLFWQGLLKYFLRDSFGVILSSLAQFSLTFIYGSTVYLYSQKCTRIQNEFTTTNESNFPINERFKLILFYNAKTFL